MFDFIYPRRKLPEAPPSAAQLVGDVVALLVAYDALFWACHRMMHWSPALFHWVHARHHERPEVLRANDALRLTFAEEVVDVGCSIAAVNLLKAHPLSRAIYNVIIVCVHPCPRGTHRSRARPMPGALQGTCW